MNTSSFLLRNGYIELFYWRLLKRFSKPVQSAFLFDNRGYDVSYYQGQIDFNKMHDYGARFVILRAGYANVKDLQFDNYFPAAKQAGLPISVYHYYDPQYTPTVQANKLLDILKDKTGIRRVWLDMEFYWTGSYSAPQHWKTYRDLIKSAGYRVGWYTRATWWDSRVGTYAADFASDPVWAAQYNNVLNLIPKGWTKALLWQAGTPTEGIAAGVTSLEIDKDYHNDEFNFIDEWGTPLPPIQEEPMSKYKILQSLNMRLAPVTGQILAVLTAGSYVWGVKDAVTGWIHISKYQIPSGAETLLNAWCSGLAAYVELVVDVPSPVADKMTIIIEQGGVKTTYTSDGKITVS